MAESIARDNEDLPTVFESSAKENEFSDLMSSMTLSGLGVRAKSTPSELSLLEDQLQSVLQTTTKNQEKFNEEVENPSKCDRKIFIHPIVTVKYKKLTPAPKASGIDLSTLVLLF